MLDLDNYLAKRAAASAEADIKAAQEFAELTAGLFLNEMAERPKPQPISTQKPN
jgi:hypothetical protein